MRGEIEDMTEMLNKDVHCTRVGQLMIQMIEFDDVTANVGRDPRDTTKLLDDTVAVVEHALDPWKRTNVGKSHGSANDDEEEAIDSQGDRGDDVKVHRGPDDYFPKRKDVKFTFREGPDGHSKLLEWQDKQITYLSSKKLEVARGLSWASMRKGRIDFTSGGGLKLANLPGSGGVR